MFSAVDRIRLYFHTLRYLKLQQTIHRLLRRFRRTRISTISAPTLRQMGGNFYVPCRRRISLLNEETFFFLNQPGQLSVLGWDDLAKPALVSKLWRYNQHYFDDLNAIDSKLRKEWHLSLIEQWTEENPLGSTIGWDPYPTSLRIVNWIKWFLLGNSPSSAALRSLVLQARWLMQNIEFHLLGNHLFANAKALVFAGAFFSDDEANLWFNKGLIIISEQLNEQVLNDGGNFELSPMYHSIFLEDLLDLINLSNRYSGLIPEENESSWKGIAKSMLSWLNCMVHPDGEIALFNDAAIGVASCPSELFSYATRLNIKFSSSISHLTHLSASGYIRIERPNMLAFLDVGLVGPDYLPGHAHADTLSFEMSFFGKRVFVNGGTSEYGTGSIRHLERGTASHNTVVIGGENSSETWSGFRVARRAYPFDLKIVEESFRTSISCKHDGYKRLKGRPVHHRTWEVIGEELIIEDQIIGEFESADAYLHINPEISISENDHQNWILSLPSGSSVIVEVIRGIANLTDSHYAPEFGKRLSAKSLKISFTSSSVCIKFTWSHNV